MSEPFRVGFVVKRYPRYSETFIVREVLAHEEAGFALEIFSLRPTDDGHFQDLISRVRARVHYLYMPAEGLLPESLAGATLLASHFWKAIGAASQELPDLLPRLGDVSEAESRDIYQALQLARIARQKKLQHLHAPFASDAATVTRLAAHFAGLPYSFTARAKDIFHQNVEPDDLGRKLRDAAGVITISDFHLDYLRRAYGPLAAKVQRVYNGLDLEEYSYQSPHNRPPVVVAVGRLVRKKGFADLIDACALLAQRRRSFRCRIIGHGYLMGELQAQVERHCLQGSVELAGPLRQSEVIREMRNAAVVAAPCVIGPDGDRDGLPNVIQEALALGTPVVTTDVAGIPEVVRDGQTGLQVPQHDPAALAEAIDRLFEDAELRANLAGNGRRLIEAEFDIRRNCRRRREIFQATDGQIQEPGIRNQESEVRSPTRLLKS